VFARSGGVWTQQGAKLVGTGAVGPAFQGMSVTTSGNTAIVGGGEDNSAAGAAWVYTRSAGVWTQQGSKLVGTGAVGLAAQGASVAISADGNTAIVGGWADNSLTGAAWVFQRGLCASSATSLCLDSGRFEISVDWINQHASPATPGVGTAVPDTDQSGFFWFFGPDNVELVVKVLDGGGVNGYFWVFYGALSDVEYTITVADKQTGAQRTYHNDPGNICGQADTAAFPSP
jgi:hypothetical protein